MKARYTLDPSHADVDACLRELAQTEIDHDAKVKARTVIYPASHVTGRRMLGFLFKLVLVLAGIAALIVWSNSQ
jgi:hypothetical protein